MSSISAVLIKPGDVLEAKYRVERILGAGGMGVVVLARHLALNANVAIKFMHPKTSAESENVERFLREARSAVHLRSEHTTRVLDIGRLKNGSPYIVMEFLVGKDLGALIEERGALPTEEAVGYVLQACEAIAEAHALGIVHRDLKPRNLFLARKPNGSPLVKVLDFGLAKVVDGTSDRGLTTTTAVMGSPQYMSPEQMRATREVDPRADIWALGVCLYELLTATVPFDAPTVPELCALVLREPPRPPRDVRPDLPPALSAVLMRCLEKNPKHRFASVPELVDALEPFAPYTSLGAGNRVREVIASTTSESAMAFAESLALPVHDERFAQKTTAEARSQTQTEGSFDSQPKNAPATSPTRRKTTLVALAAASAVVVTSLAGVALVGRRQNPGSAALLASSDPRTGSSAVAHPPPVAAVPIATAAMDVADAGADISRSGDVPRDGLAPPAALSNAAATARASAGRAPRRAMPTVKPVGGADTSKATPAAPIPVRATTPRNDDPANHM